MPSGPGPVSTHKQSGEFWGSGASSLPHRLAVSTRNGDINVSFDGINSSDVEIIAAT